MLALPSKVSIPVLCQASAPTLILDKFFNYITNISTYFTGSLSLQESLFCYNLCFKPFCTSLYCYSFLTISFTATDSSISGVWIRDNLPILLAVHSCSCKSTIALKVLCDWTSSIKLGLKPKFGKRSSPKGHCWGQMRTLLAQWTENSCIHTHEVDVRVLVHQVILSLNNYSHNLIHRS